MAKSKLPETRVSLFQGKKIRKVIYHDEWWFVITDVVSVLTDSVQPAGYIKDMRRRDPELSKGWGQIATPLLIETIGGSQRLNCANTKGLFRIIQSIPSPKAEPLKQWLAKVGYERIQEIEDPELAITRAKSIYSKKGYSPEWVEKRMRGIAVRNELTDEWKNRGAKEGVEYAILTNEIMQGTFGLNVKSYKQKKNLTTQNLRDHMDDLELIFTMLGEATTTKLTTDKNSKGYDQLKSDAHLAGVATGKARKNIEETINKKVVSSNNYLNKQIK